MTEAWNLTNASQTQTGIQRTESRYYTYSAIGTWAGATLSLTAEHASVSYPVDSRTADGGGPIWIDADLSYKLSLTGGSGTEDVNILLAGTPRFGN